MIEDFVTMKNGQPQRIVYKAGKLHFNETLKYGVKSGKFMDKGHVQNISQCISLCGRQPDCDLAFMLGPQCYAVSCGSQLLCATKPAYSAFYNPAIVFVTDRKIFSVGTFACVYVRSLRIFTLCAFAMEILRKHHK